MANEKSKKSEELLDNVQNLKNLIAYQNGSVVSRSILKKESGRDSKKYNFPEYH